MVFGKEMRLYKFNLIAQIIFSPKFLVCIPKAAINKVVDWYCIIMNILCKQKERKIKNPWASVTTTFTGNDNMFCSASENTPSFIWLNMIY
jgi:hypothetical protein